MSRFFFFFFFSGIAAEKTPKGAFFNMLSFWIMFWATAAAMDIIQLWNVSEARSQYEFPQIRHGENLNWALPNPVSLYK